jgi:hypothetical protein
VHLHAAIESVLLTVESHRGLVWKMDAVEPAVWSVPETDRCEPSGIATITGNAAAI